MIVQSYCIPVETQIELRPGVNPDIVIEAFEHEMKTAFQETIRKIWEENKVRMSAAWTVNKKIGIDIAEDRKEEPDAMPEIPGMIPGMMEAFSQEILPEEDEKKPEEGGN